MANWAFVTVTNGMVEARPCQGQGERAREKSFVCLFVCLLINYNVAFDRINVMATINVRQRISVRETGHIQAHTIKILGPTSRDPVRNHPHPRQNDPPKT